MSKTSLLFAVISIAAFGCETLPASSTNDPNSKAIVKAAAPSKELDLSTASLQDIAVAIEAGDITSREITAAYLARIAEIDEGLQSVLTINPNALDDAKDLDAMLAAGQKKGPLHGVPILLKDNIETADPMPTTAGAYALAENMTGRDAPLVARLRSNGAVILGKTNLSQWANFRSEGSISGWSAIGGQVRNPHALDRSPCGSSSGSGAATSASLAAATIGTETNGSIICPSSMQGIVGFKPTVGLVSQDLIIPISHTQDTAGPMTRTVTDAAIMLSSMADPAHPAFKTDFTKDFSKNALQGKRIGVLRFAQGNRPEISSLFEASLSQLEEAGAILVDIEKYDVAPTFWEESYHVLKVEFAEGINSYLANTPNTVTTRTLEQLVTFNEETETDELQLFNQDIFTGSLEAASQPKKKYEDALENVLKATRQNGIDKMLADHEVDLLVAPSTNPAFLIDPVFGDSYQGGVGAGWIAAIAGYPHLTVPMGQMRGLPVGLSIIAGANQDQDVLKAGFVFEQKSQKFTPPTFLKTIDDLPSIKNALQAE